MLQSMSPRSLRFCAILCSVGPLLCRIQPTLAAAAADPVAFCARAGNDDAVRGYTGSARAAFLRAYKKLYPNSTEQLKDEDLQRDAAFRCMNGQAYACFGGGNRPCAKEDSQRHNPAVETFCREHPSEKSVPLVILGHDSIYTWSCHAGKAHATATEIRLDSRGFATDLWTPLD
jgi:hypothetical protein